MAFIVKRGRKQVGPEFRTYSEAQVYALKLLDEDMKGVFTIEEVT